ncbi:MAG TPA: glutathione S-transferase family protein [bacterium]|nr:glutathione S-transferase family protein [bacterium]
MGRLINGQWSTENSLNSDDHSGEFIREQTTFRNWIQDDPSAEFPAEPDRYHLYISRACPWAHRTAIMRRWKGLEEAISLSLVEPVRINAGWEFSETDPDPLYASRYLREVYQKADPDATCRVSVPILWDKQKETIVNNESREIMRMLDTQFNDFAKQDATFYPGDLREQVDRTIDEIYAPINNGVYRTGFAGTQRAYDKAVTELFDALDHWNAVLDDQRYLCGDVLTEADICMFTTMYRFDNVYHTHFKCNLKRITDYPNLWNYTRELYQLPGVAETCNMDHVKRHYYMSHTWLNPTQIVPKGPIVYFDDSHDRDRLPVRQVAEFTAGA